MTRTAHHTEILARMRSTVRELYRDAIKFGVVGALAFIVDMGSFNLLRHTVLEDKPTAAVIVSASIATVFAWIGNRSWTFRHRRNRQAHYEAILFAATNGAALIIQAATVATSHYALGFASLTADNIAKAIAICIGTIFRFWAYRRFVFAGEPDADGDDRYSASGRNTANRAG